MLTKLIELGSEYPKLRRPITQLYRRAWRIRRATLAQAVLVIQNKSGRVLTLRNSGQLALPFIDLHAGEAITTQVEDRARAILNGDCGVSLVAVEGTPSRKGVTFLYSGSVTDAPLVEGWFWIDPAITGGRLTETESRHLSLCITPHKDISSKA